MFSQSFRKIDVMISPFVAAWRSICWRPDCAEAMLLCSYALSAVLQLATWPFQAVGFCAEVGSFCSMWMDEIHFAPPKKPWNDNSPVNTNNQWVPMFSKCRILSIHRDPFRTKQMPAWLRVNTNGIPFSCRCTTHFSPFWRGLDVQWGYGSLTHSHIDPR